MAPLTRMMLTVVLLPVAAASAAPQETAHAPALELEHPAATPSGATRQALDRGLQAYQQGHLAEALLQYRRAAESAPSDDGLWYDVGCLQALLHDADARASFQRALRLNPYRAAAHDALGQLAEQDGDVEEARVCYRNATTLDPEQPNYLWRMIRIDLKQNRTAEAQQALSRLLLLDPASLQARYALGVLDLRSDEPDLAIHEFHAVVDRQPDHVLAWNGLALAYARIGERAASDEALEHAKTLDPENPVTRTHEGLLAAYQQRWQQARTAWEHVVALDPSFEPAARNLEALKTMTDGSAR